jgi:hypothetical protein
MSSASPRSTAWSTSQTGRHALPLIGGFLVPTSVAQPPVGAMANRQPTGLLHIVLDAPDELLRCKTACDGE